MSTIILSLLLVYFIFCTHLHLSCEVPGSLKEGGQFTVPPVVHLRPFIALLILEIPGMRDGYFRNMLKGKQKKRTHILIFYIF